MRQFIAVLTIGLLATALRADDGPITIKIKQPAVGDVVKEHKIDTTTNKITFTVNGKEQKQDESVIVKQAYTEEVVAKPAGAKNPTKLKRTYETAEFTKDGVKEDLGLAGKTVSIEKSGDGYEITIAGQAVTGKAGELLKKEFGKEKNVTDEDLMPKEPVKVGGTWKVDLANFAKDAADELEIDVAKSSATGKLIKAYDKSGRKFGVVEVTMELALTKVGGGGQAVDLKAGSKLNLTFVLDMCIDGSTSSATGKVTVKGDFSGTANGIDLKFELASIKEGGSVEVEKK